MSHQYISMFLNLLFIITLIVAMYFFIRKFKLTKHGQEKIVNILQVLTVGSKEKIVLIEANKNLILLGVTANRIETLYTMEREAQINNASEINQHSFSHIINHANMAAKS